MKFDKLNLFYEEPDSDRWFKFDRYPRRVVRRLIRGKQRPGGVGMIAVNLMKGLDQIGVGYRLNDYAYIRKHPQEVAGIIGKPHVLFEKKWANPVLFGAGIYSHPMEYPNLFKQYPNIRRFLVPGEWMREMFAPLYGDKVSVWPVGIDTAYWRPSGAEKTIDFLIYDKIRWDHTQMESTLTGPLTEILQNHHHSYHFIRYGNYTHQELTEKLSVSKAVIFLCEHETQGLAYQQILATGTPIMAWERGGYWQDPYYYPDKVKYQPVSAVPYWDGRCGIKFTNASDFEEKMALFLRALPNFSPRDYITENLTLAICAEKYIQLYHEVEKEISG